MKVIHTQADPVSKLWGEGSICQTDYRLLRYALCQPIDGGVLYLNVVTGELVYLTTEEAACISSDPVPYTPAMDELIRRRFLVPADTDEQKIVEQLRRALRLTNHRKDITGYTILPTSNCNARCFYCYESDYCHVNMSEETAAQVVDFIAAHCGGKPVRLSWFGGEPLVGKARIDQICSSLAERGISFGSTMTSNGFLFSEELAAHARESWKLRKIQITLDGTEEIYNRTKAYTDTSVSGYQRVTENIGHLIKNGIRVSIRMNLGPHNADDLTLLARELAERFPDKKLLRPYVYVLFDNVGYDPAHYDREQLEGLINRQRELERLLVERGFPPIKEALPSLKFQRCMADNDASVLINPKGELGKCEHYSFDWLVGTLAEGITDPESVTEWKKRKTYPNCEDCPLAPSCFYLVRCTPARDCTETMRDRLIENNQALMERKYRQFLEAESAKAAREEAAVNDAPDADDC